MERQETQDTLAKFREAIHQQFEDRVGTHEGRLQQLDHALDTAAMSADALFDEEEREVDLAVRVMNDEATSPVPGRSKKDYYGVIAKRSK